MLYHRLEQQLYIYLLQRYLQFRYQSECQSKTKLSKLMSILYDLKLMYEIERWNGFEDYLPYFGPLFTEIMNFNELLK